MGVAPDSMIRHKDYQHISGFLWPNKIVAARRFTLTSGEDALNVVREGPRPM